MEWLTEPDIWIGFVTLLALEIVLGIDNVVFISILAEKLSTGQQARARQVGVGLALIMRILLLLTLSWVIGHEISGRDLILIVGGLFLLGKSTYEIHDRLEGEEGHATARVAASFPAVIAQIVILDAVFPHSGLLSRGELLSFRSS